MVKEISNQLYDKPDAIFCSVGGGGLLGGIIVGCNHVGWDDGAPLNHTVRHSFITDVVLRVVPIVALETIGTDCFFHSMSLNKGSFNVNPPLPAGVDIVHDAENNVKLAHFSRFSSKASGSLGASQPSARVKMALGRQGGVKCVSMPDELSMQSLVSFLGKFKLFAVYVDPMFL